MSDAVKVRADKVATGDRIKIGPLWFTVTAVKIHPFRNYPEYFVDIHATDTDGNTVVLTIHKYTLVTITEGSTNHGTRREADSRPQF